MKKRMLALSALAMIVAGGAMAGEPRGMQTFEIRETWPAVYVPCLNEELTTTVFIEVRFHEFVTPSGVTHFAGSTVEHYLATTPSGREWVGGGVYSEELNSRIGKGQTYQFGRRLRLMPTTEDTPIVMFKFQAKWTVNANGEPVVFERWHFPHEEAFTCLRNAK
jgi:hypothetical protein